jgi:dTDP-glucose 4,6-dehydratase
LPIQTLKVGALGTHKALGLAKAKGARFLLASTSEVYGDPQVHPQPESYWGNVNPIGVRGVYDEAKRFAEAMTMAYYRYHSVDTRIIRIFNTYGPRMRLNDGRVVPNFIAQALQGQALTVYGGKQTRSFCYVDDLVEGIYRLVMTSEEQASDVHNPVNLGNPEEYSIMQFAEIINRLTDNPGGIVFQDKRIKDDPETRKPDITRAQQLLGWEPHIKLEQGLVKTIEWFKPRL